MSNAVFLAPKVSCNFDNDIGVSSGVSFADTASKSIAPIPDAIDGIGCALYLLATTPDELLSVMETTVSL